jgi:ketosteroid isomerase-like protein
MGEGDIELLRELYEEWERGDFSRDFFAPDVVSHAHGIVGMVSGQHGREEMLATQLDWLRHWERPFRIEAEEFLDGGDLVVVLIRWRGRGKGSGVEVEAEGAHVWELRDGKAVRYDIYRDREQALEAAGLSAGTAQESE